MVGAVGFQKSTERSAAWIVGGNPRNVYRLVGYLEYGRSLYLLDELLDLASAEELKVIEELVAERPEFAVYTNLSRLLEPQPGALSEPASDSDVAAPAGKYRQQGLAWITALARVELAAMSAGFDVDDHPFRTFAPSRYEAAQYALMLMDALRTHYWALQRDPLVRDIRNAGLNDVQGLAYFRRVAVAIEMADALERLGKGSYSPGQLEQLKSWRREMKSLRGTVLYSVLKLHDRTTVEQKWTSALRSCPALVRIAREDLLAGTAEVDGRPITPEEGKAILRTLAEHSERTEVRVIVND